MLPELNEAELKLEELREKTDQSKAHNQQSLHYLFKVIKIIVKLEVIVTTQENIEEQRIQSSIYAITLKVHYNDL